MSMADVHFGALNTDFIFLRRAAGMPDKEDLAGFGEELQKQTCPEEAFDGESN